MKFTLEQNKLAEICSLAVGATESKIQMVTSFALFVVENKQLTISATNYDITVVATTEVEKSKDGTAAILLSKLYSLIKKFASSKQISIRKLKGSWIEVACGKSKYKVPCMEMGDFPDHFESILLEKPQFSIKITQAGLKRLIDKTAFCMSNDEYRRIMNGVFLEVTGPSVIFTSTDNFCLATAVEPIVERSEQTDTAVIHRRGIHELKKVLKESEDVVTIEKLKNTVLFKTDTWKFLIKEILGDKYPDYRKVLPGKYKVSVQLSRATLINALQRVALVSRAESKVDVKKVRIDPVEPDKIRFTTKTSDVGEGFEELTVKEGEIKQDDKDPLFVHTNPSLMLEVLKVIPDRVVNMRLSGRYEPVVFKQEENILLVMPIAIT